MLHKLAWYQLISEKRRLVAALAGIGFAVMLQLTQFGFRDALFDSATVFHDKLVADLVMTSSLYESEITSGSVTRRRLYQALGASGVESVTPVNFSGAVFKNPVTFQDKTIIVIGFDPDQAAMNVPSVRETAKLIKVPDTALFDALSRPEFGPIVENFRRDGSVTTEIGGRRMKILGLFELGTSFAGNGHVIVSDGTFRKMFNRPEGLFEFGLIRVKPGADVAAVQADLTTRLAPDIRVLTVGELSNVEKGYWAANTPIGFIFLLGAAVGLLVGAVIVYQILYTDVADHLAEYATMKAMGYTDTALMIVVIEEALILSIMGFPIGLGLAQLLYRVSREATHLPLYMTTPRALMVFGLTILMCCGSGLLAIRKLKSADPAEVF